MYTHVTNTFTHFNYLDLTWLQVRNNNGLNTNDLTHFSPHEIFISILPSQFSWKPFRLYFWWPGVKRKEQFSHRAPPLCLSPAVKGHQQHTIILLLAFNTMILSTTGYTYHIKSTNSGCSSNPTRKVRVGREKKLVLSTILHVRIFLCAVSSICFTHSYSRTFALFPFHLTLPVLIDLLSKRWSLNVNSVHYMKKVQHLKVHWSLWSCKRSTCKRVNWRLFLC